MLEFPDFFGLINKKKTKELYDDPETFKPERYLKSEFGTRPGADTSDFRGDWIFGSGRVCETGLVHRSATVFINFTSASALAMSLDSDS